MRHGGTVAKKHQASHNRFFKLKNSNLKVKVTTSFGVHWSSGSRDIAHLICHMTSQNHIINVYVTGGQGQV